MTQSLAYDGTLRSFFFERLGCVQERRGESISTDVEAYLVNLLAEFARRSDAAGRTAHPLATQYLRAREAGAGALRAVGDRALYIAGVVPESLDRGPVGVAYVQAIGRSAYLDVSAFSHSLNMFEELAETFETLTRLLGDAVEPPAGEAPGSLLELYERWRRHGRSRDAERLLAAGVLLDPDGSDLIQ